jgi:hypothetical protein
MGQSAMMDHSYNFFKCGGSPAVAFLFGNIRAKCDTQISIFGILKAGAEKENQQRDLICCFGFPKNMAGILSGAGMAASGYNET